jgi:hypothetical protein
MTVHGSSALLAIVKWIPNQRAMICRNSGPRSHMRVEQSVHTHLYNFA